MKLNVQAHSRRLPSGRTTKVRQHRRGYSPASRKPFSKAKGIFALPVRTAIIVPSTTDKNKPVSKAEMAKRVEDTRRFLNDTNGGTTSVKAVGGYTDNKGNVIKEPVVVVESYATRKGFVKNKKKVRRYLEQKGKAWKQESMGYEHENDLYYVDQK